MEQSSSWEANSLSANQEIPGFYGTRKFITVFTRSRHLSLSRASCRPIPRNITNWTYTAWSCWLLR